MMNSFLFNVWLLLLCAVACVQFCFAAFQSYAQLTAIDMLLGVQVRTIHTQHKRRITHTAHTQLTHTPSLLPLRSLSKQVRNLIGLNWFFANDFFFYTMFGISGLTLLYLCVFPTDKRALEDD